MELSRPLVGVGLMSGTSVDGIDVIILRFPAGKVSFGRCEVLAYKEVPFEPQLAAKVKDAMVEGSSKLLCELNVELGLAYAAAIGPQPFALDFVACHGQTVHHLPAHHSTLQLGCANTLQQQTGAEFCISNFRAADMAAGGTIFFSFSFFFFSSSFQERELLWCRFSTAGPGEEQRRVLRW
jgi:anhydro-N-acetylmuramic acid kinase